MCVWKQNVFWLLFYYKMEEENVSENFVFSKQYMTKKLLWQKIFTTSLASQ